MFSVVMVQVNLSEQVKSEIEQIKEDQDHKSLDSVVRVLLERSRVVSDHRLALREVLEDDQMPQPADDASENLKKNPDRLVQEITDEYEYIDAGTARGILKRCAPESCTTEQQLLERARGFIEGSKLLAQYRVNNIDFEGENPPDSVTEVCAVLGGTYGGISAEKSEELRKMVEEYNVPLEEAGRSVAMSMEQESGEWVDVIQSAVNTTPTM